MRFFTILCSIKEKKNDSQTLDEISIVGYILGSGILKYEQIGILFSDVWCHEAGVWE